MSYPCLVPEGQQPIQIQTKVFTIGKLEKNLLRIDVLLSTSTQHAEILVQDKVYILDKQSMNGTLINGVKLGSSQRMELASGDVIQFGKYPILYTFYPETKLAYLKNQQKAPTPVKDVKISVLDYVNKKSRELQQQQQQQQILPSQLQQPSQQKIGIATGISLQEERQDPTPLRQEDNNKAIYNRNLETAQQIIGQLERENNDLKTQSLQLQQDYERKGQQYLELQFKMEKLQGELKGLQGKYEQVEPYIKDLQTRLDLAIKENELKAAELEEFKITDVGKKIAIQSAEIAQLKKILQIRDDEIANQRKQINQLLSNVSGNPSHHIQMLEQNAREMTQLKKQLQEWETRDNECNRKWTALLRDNAQKEEQIRGLKFQLDRQIQNLQSLYAEFDKRNHDLNARILGIIESQGQQQQREAANFLVQQVSLIQEERRIFAMENEDLHRNLQEVITELELLKKEEFYMPDGTNVTQLIVAMRHRIEELNDILSENKYRDSTDHMVQQNQLIEELETKLITLRKKCELQEQQIFQLKNNNPQGFIDGQNDFYQKRIGELQNLVKEYQRKINILEGTDKQKELQIENMKFQLNTLTNFEKPNAHLAAVPSLLIPHDFRNEKISDN